MKTIQYFRYSTQVWLISLFLSPPLLMLWEEGFDLIRDPRQGFGMLLLMVLFGGFYSIPNWLLLTAGVAAVDRLPWTATAKRLLIQVWAMILTAGLFALVFDDSFGRDGDGLPVLPLCYAATLTFGIWTCRLPGEERRVDG